MGKQRIYIIQFLGIVLLLCAYLVGNRPDSESVMHFVHNPPTPYVLSKATKSATITSEANYSSNQKDKSSRKFHLGKRVVYQVILPTKHMPASRFIQPATIAYTPALPENYNYLYYREINPPPPKA